MTKITMLIGLPASGKSYYVNQNLPDSVVLSRDAEGGNIIDLLPKMCFTISQNIPHVVLDCTFLTRESRKPFIEKAKELNTTIEAVFFNTKPEIAQFNICWRMCERYGKVLRTPQHYARVKHDPNMFNPTAFFSMVKKLEKPQMDEGFSKIHTVPGKRFDLPSRFSNSAVMLDYDGTLRDTISGNKYPKTPQDIKAFPQAAKKLQELKSQGVLLLGASNQSGVAKNDPPEEVCRKCFDETNKQLGVGIHYDFDISPAGPISSWCRKPMPGMGVDFIWKYNLNPHEVIYVGDQTTDKTFAERCGFQFAYAKDFFKL